MFVSILIIACLGTTGDFHVFVLPSVYLLQQKGEGRTQLLSAVIGWPDARPTAYALVMEGEQTGYS